MPTDATGAPTSLGIRKYNTSADAPSGLGFNGAMDDIDALLVARVAKPAGIVAGEFPVWNGSSFVRSSATNVTGLLPGYSYSYDEFTASIPISATTDATANGVVSSSAVTYDGATNIWIEFFAPKITTGSDGRLLIVLYQNGVSIGRLADIQLAAANTKEVFLRRKLLPPAGSDTYSINAFVTAGTGAVAAGLGGSGVLMRGYLAAVKA